MTRQEFRRIRLRLGLTQVELAHLFGMNRNTVTRWELGLLRFPKMAGWAIKGVQAEERGTTRRRAGGS